MKKTVLALALAATTAAHAEVVTVAGYGSTYQSALASCQLTAAKRVTGTWIASEQSVENGKYVEDLAAYDGAIINRTQVLSYDSHAMVCEVDVDPVKDNKVTTKESIVPVENIKRIHDDRNQFQSALKFVDNPSRALRVVVNDIVFEVDECFFSFGEVKAEWVGGVIDAAFVGVDAEVVLVVFPF